MTVTQRKLFGTDGIRAIAGEETPEEALMNTQKTLDAIR